MCIRLPVIPGDMHEQPPSHKSLTAECRKVMLPKLLVIGLNHGASTTLAMLLDQHPNVTYGWMKEHQLFHKREKEYEDALQRYQLQFTVPCSVEVTFDASPCYWALGNTKGITKVSGWPELPFSGPRAVQRVRDTLGSDLRIIFTVRDPVDWLLSMREHGMPNEGVGDDFVSLSCFADSLQTWIDVFGRDRFKFIDIDDVLTHRDQVVDEILEWMGLSPPRNEPRTVVGGRRRTTTTVSMEERMQFHSVPEHVECRKRLETIMGSRLSWPGSEDTEEPEVATSGEK